MFFFFFKLKNIYWIVVKQNYSIQFISDEIHRNTHTTRTLVMQDEKKKLYRVNK